jgi:hypothetical protein
MVRPAFRFIAICAALLGFSGCASQYFREAGTPPAAPRYSLAELPDKDIWTGVVFNGNKIGFTHTRVASAGEHRWAIEGEAVMRFHLLGFDKRVQASTRDIVDDEARLLEFDYRYVLDESTQRVMGTVREGRIAFELSDATGRAVERREIPVIGPLYPAGALDLLPVLQGLRVGAEFRWQVFNGETQSVDEAVQRIESYETSELFQGPAFKLRTEMLGMDSTTWLDAHGRPLFELAMNGVMIAALEDESTARGYLAAAALNRNDAILEWSLVKAPLALPDPHRAVYLRIVLPDAARPPLSDERQNCRREAADIICEIDATRPAAPGSADEALRPSAIVTSNDPKIRELARGLVDERAPAHDKVAAILVWINANIAPEAVDAFSARDVLDAKRGECQGHAWLYAALARALGVPTRIVNGLVYAPEYGGFLYHTWAESLIDGDWRAVDPTFGQAQADATHLALGRGESMADLVPLVEWMGKTRIRVVEAR